MKRDIIYILVIIVLAGTYFGKITKLNLNTDSTPTSQNLANANTNTMTFPYPLPTSLIGINNFKCKSVVLNVLLADDGFISKKPGINSVRNTSTPDSFVINVNGDTMTLQSDANQKAGRSPEKYEVLSTTEDYLLAVQTSVDYTDVFALDKKNGLGITNITRSLYLGSTGPESESEYLHCQ